MSARAGCIWPVRAQTDMSVSMLERGRNKLSVTLDLKRPEAREVFDDLVVRADVVVENFSAGTADRIGVGVRSTAREVNPRIVYLSISGFGAGEPGKGMDAIFQALSGLMLTPGSYGDPPVRNAVPFGDLTGPLFGVIGTLAALYMREGRARPARRRRAARGADLAARDRALGHDGAGRDRDADRQRRAATRAVRGLPTTRDGFVAVCAPTEPFARGVVRGASGGPSSTRTTGSRTAIAGSPTQAELHGSIAAWTATSTVYRGDVAALDAQGVAGGDRARHRDRRARPARPRRGETVPLAHPELGPVDDLYGSGFPVGSRRRGRATTPRRRGSASTTSPSSAGCSAIRRSGSSRFAPPALSKGSSFVKHDRRG